MSNEKPKFTTGDVETKGRIWDRMERLLGKMDERDKKRTTLAIAEVETKDGQQERWIAAAGTKGDVRPSYLEPGERVIKNKDPNGNTENRLNDAEQTILREVREKEAKIIGLGASRPGCDKCRDAYLNSGDLNAIVTPLKNPIPEHTP